MERSETAIVAGRESAENFLVAAEFKLHLFKARFLITAGIKSGDLHLASLFGSKCSQGNLSLIHSMLPLLASVLAEDERFVAAHDEPGIRP